MRKTEYYKNLIDKAKAEKDVVISALSLIHI